MNPEIVVEIFVSIGVIVAMYLGFKSGWKSHKEHSKKMKEQIDRAGMIGRRYSTLKLPLTFVVGWLTLSFLFSLNGLTIIQPYMVNSTALWNWVCFLVAIFITGGLVLSIFERVYLKVRAQR